MAEIIIVSMLCLFVMVSSQRQVQSCPAAAEIKEIHRSDARGANLSEPRERKIALSMLRIVVMHCHHV